MNSPRKYAGVAASGSSDALTGENLTAFAVVPATFRLSENTRLNFNGGWLWDRSVDRHYFTYGIGFDWFFKGGMGFYMKAQILDQENPVNPDLGFKCWWINLELTKYFEY